VRVPPFDAWLPQVTPAWRWDWPYLAYMRQYLDKITSGELDRLMLFLPPRHGKTEMVTVRYPVWRLEGEPGLRVIVGAYNQLLANKFSRKARRIAESRFALASDRAAVEDWETAGGGGFRAIGVGAGITGQGGHLVVIDDPVKNRKEAESAVYRDWVWDWYTDDLYTRLEPGAAIILIMTRWHQDDLAGRILASEDGPNWTVVSLPAEAEKGDPLDRGLGEALCPARYPVPTLARIRSVLGGHSYAALYQQKPYPPEGALARREWFPIVGAAPAEGARLRFWEFAATEKSAKASDPDWMVGTRMVMGHGLWYIEDVIRARIGPGAVEALVKQTAALDGWSIAISFEQEPAAAGKLFAAAMIKALAGYNVHAEPATGDKVTRALPFFAQAEAGNVRLLHGPWNEAWLQEITAFPLGGHDDQVDSASGAFNELTRPPEINEIVIWDDRVEISPF